MQASWTQLRSLRGFVQVPAIDTTPSDCAVTCKNATLFEIGRQFLVTFAMLLFSDGDALKGYGDLGKSFFTCGFCKFRIQPAPLMLLASSGSFQVVERCSSFAGWVTVSNLNVTAFQETEKPFCMLFFL